MIKLKEYCKKLFLQIWFYKEYVIVFFIGLTTITWLMLSLGSTKANSLEKFTSKSSVNSLLLENKIKLPNINAFISTIKNEEFNKKLFIEKYKSLFKAQNSIKGKVSLSFNFYEKDYMISSVEIIIKFFKKDVDKMIVKKQIIRISKNNL